MKNNMGGPASSLGFYPAGVYAGLIRSGQVVPFGSPTSDIELADSRAGSTSPHLLASENELFAAPTAPLATELSVWQRTVQYAVYLSIPVAAVLTSMSLSIFILMVNETKKQDLREKLTVPAAVWLVLSLAVCWEYWQLNGRRADGRVDANAQQSNANFRADPLHLLIAFLAGIPRFFNGVLVAIAAPPLQGSVPRLVVGGVVLGTLNWMGWGVVNLQATWRKYIEGTQISPLADQPVVRYLYRHSRALSVFLRETYPPAVAIIAAQAFFQALQVPTPAFEPRVKNAIVVFLSVWVFLGGASMNRNFDIRQIKDCVTAQGLDFSMQGILAGSQYAVLRLLGKALNGQLLGDGLDRLGVPPKAIAYIVAALQTLGMGALISRGLEQYLSSFHADRGLLLHVILGPKAAVEAAKTAVPLLMPIAITLSAVQSLTKVATVTDQLEKDYAPRERQTQIVPVLGVS